MNKKIVALLVAVFFNCLFSTIAYGWATTSYPFYIGASTGWGSTNWSGLVDKNGFNDGSDLSVPVEASDTGQVWGILGGVEVNQNFAIQGEYQHYPTAWVGFDDFNQYFPAAENMPSNTVAYNAIAKFMVPIYHTGIRAFSDLGPSYTYRTDSLAHVGHWGATFGGGFNYNLLPQLMVELNFNYTTGWDKSDTTPVLDYLPFLYSVNMALAYRFNV